MRAVAVRRDAWLSHPLLRWMQIGIIAIGCAFWIEARLTAEAFSADIFGHFALMFPAEAWAGVMASASLMVWIGLIDPVKRWMVAVGAAIQTLQYLALGYSAIMTGGEPVIGLHCTVLFAPLFAAMFWRAVNEPDA